ncbi:MAG: hypothetical protein JNK41_03520 [Saprospiraceae bacterium]|nr:hypothetical protein [Saprospiraceae bacterium]
MELNLMYIYINVAPLGLDKSSKIQKPLLSKRLCGPDGTRTRPDLGRDDRAAF